MIQPEMSPELATKIVHNITNRKSRQPIEGDTAVVLKYALQKWEDDNLTFYIEELHPILTSTEVPESFSQSQITLLNTVIDEIIKDEEDTRRFNENISKIDFGSLMK